MNELLNHLWRSALAAVAMPLAAGLLQAQSPAFEVASIRPSSPDARGVIMQFMHGGGVRMINARVRQVITLAYGVERFQVTGGPAWLDSQGFDIVAKGDGGGEAQARTRLQALLADRFKLSLREERREAPVLALRVAKNGHKLKESSQGFDGISGRPGQVFAERVGIPVLASYLSSQLGRPVVDQTGLTRTYAFKLEWTPDGGGPLAKEKADGAQPGDPDGPAITTAIQTQLGLRIESTRGVVPVYIVEKVEKPSEN